MVETRCESLTSRVLLNYCRYYNNNVWPDKDEAGVEGFEEAFKE